MQHNESDTSNCLIINLQLLANCCELFKPENEILEMRICYLICTNAMSQGSVKSKSYSFLGLDWK